MNKTRIIYTGGTIGGKYGLEGNIEYGLSSKDFIETLYQKCPNLKKDLENNLSFRTPIKKFSEDIVPTDWTKIAKSVDDAVNDGIGSVIIFHGTDTMCYTSSALSFALQGIDIPVILTGSNIPLEREGTDAIVNMRDAFIVALEKGEEEFKGVFVVFSGVVDKPSDIHLGFRVRKEQFFDNCFKSVNVDKIGTVENNSSLKNSNINFTNKQLFRSYIENNNNIIYKLINDFDDKISFFKVYPGFNPKLINYAIEDQTKGIILELYNGGTGCKQGKYSLLKSLSKAGDIPVFVTSQHKGNVLMNTYKSSIDLKAAGAVPLKDMITETAITKLMWVLKQANNKDDVIKLMLTNFCGEIDSNE